jgi:hypothetical protein
MIKMEQKGLKYGIAQKPIFQTPKIKIELTEQEIEERKTHRLQKREIKQELILQSQALDNNYFQAQNS